MVLIQQGCDGGTAGPFSDMGVAPVVKRTKASNTGTGEAHALLCPASAFKNQFQGLVSGHCRRLQLYPAAETGPLHQGTSRAPLHLPSREPVSRFLCSLFCPTTWGEPGLSPKGGHYHCGGLACQQLSQAAGWASTVESEEMEQRLKRCWIQRGGRQELPVPGEPQLELGGQTERVQVSAL